MDEQFASDQTFLSFVGLNVDAPTTVCPLTIPVPSVSSCPGVCLVAHLEILLGGIIGSTRSCAGVGERWFLAVGFGADFAAGAAADSPTVGRREEPEQPQPKTMSM